jgi:uncharacterized membrane-anchored protein
MKLKLVILVLALQTAWLLGTVARQEQLLHNAPTVLLETRPVDPRDPLRGDFLRLNYAISDLARNQFTPPLTNELTADTTVYVALAPGGTNGCWQFVRAGRDPLQPVGNEIVLRGKSSWSWRDSGGTVHVEYGIEQYFVPEGTGNPSGKLTVQVAVSQSGGASIKQVFVDGKPYTEVVQSSR